MADIFNPVNLHVFTEHLSSLSQVLYLIGKLEICKESQETKMTNFTASNDR